VRIELTRRNGDVVLAIADSAAARGRRRRDGLSIVRALVRDELQGSFELRNDGGTRAEVVFPGEESPCRQSRVPVPEPGRGAAAQAPLSLGNCAKKRSCCATHACDFGRHARGMPRWKRVHPIRDRPAPPGCDPRLVRRRVAAPHSGVGAGRRARPSYYHVREILIDERSDSPARPSVPSASSATSPAAACQGLMVCVAQHKRSAAPGPELTPRVSRRPDPRGRGREARRPTQRPAAPRRSGGRGLAGARSAATSRRSQIVGESGAFATATSAGAWRSARARRSPRA